MAWIGEVTCICLSQQVKLECKESAKTSHKTNNTIVKQEQLSPRQTPEPFNGLLTSHLVLLHVLILVILLLPPSDSALADIQQQQVLQVNYMQGNWKYLQHAEDTERVLSVIKKFLHYSKPLPSSVVPRLSFTWQW